MCTSQNLDPKAQFISCSMAKLPLPLPILIVPVSHMLCKTGTFQCRIGNNSHMCVVYQVTEEVPLVNELDDNIIQTLAERGPMISVNIAKAVGLKTARQVK